MILSRLVVSLPLALTIGTCAVSIAKLPAIAQVVCDPTVDCPVQDKKVEPIAMKLPDKGLRKYLLAQATPNQPDLPACKPGEDEELNKCLGAPMDEIQEEGSLLTQATPEQPDLPACKPGEDEELNKCLGMPMDEIQEEE